MKRKRLLSIKDLAAEYGITDWFWRTQIWDKNLPYIQVERKMLIDREDECKRGNHRAMII